MDIEELKKWLREKKLFQPTGVEAADTIESLQSELAALRKELEEARKDAERINYLERDSTGFVVDVDRRGREKFRLHLFSRWHTTLRAAIDAARKQELT